MNPATDLTGALNKLLVNRSWLKTFLLEEHESPGVVSAIRHYALAMREAEPLLDDFARSLADEIVNFCMPRKRIAKALKNMETNALSAAPILALRREARQLFQDYCTTKPDRSGEAGELLAFCLTEHVLRAPMAVAKMQLKTNTNMPVHGADGLHVRYIAEDDALEVIFVESKVHASLNSGAKAAGTSIRGFIDNKQTGLELRLALDFGNFDTLDEESSQKLEEYLDPYAGTKTASRRDRFSSLIVYSDPVYNDCVSLGTEAMAKLRPQFQKECATRKDVVDKALAGASLSSDTVTTLIVALPDVVAFRAAFNQALANG